MNCANVLSYSAIILGLYILWNFLFFNDSKSKGLAQTQYHIGCYLIQQNINQYDLLIDRLNDLRRKSQFKKQGNTSLVAPDFFNKKGVQVAQNFQYFIDEYKYYKSRTQINVDFSKAVNRAHKDFIDCTIQLNGNLDFSSVRCLNDWQAYSKCTIELDGLKRKLNNGLKQKEDLMQKIKLLLNKDKPKLSTSHDDDVIKQFNRKDRELQDKEKLIEGDTKILNEKLSSARFNYDLIKKNLDHAQKRYLECSEHRIQFRLCQQLSEEIRGLGHASIESLEDKVRKKRIALAKIQILLRQNEGRESSAELKNLYYSNLEVFQRLLKLFVETKARIIIHCGCSEAEQLKLKAAYDAALREQQNKNREVNQIIQKLSIQLKNLDAIRNQRKILLQNLNKHRKLSTPKPQTKVDVIAQLNKYQKQFENYQVQISKLDTNFSDLQQKCRRIRNNLSSQIISISKVNDCLNKYQYYNQLKEKYDKELPKDIKINDLIKRKLIKSVQEFTYK